MTKNWSYVALGEIAPASSLPLPSPDSDTWNLSLEEIEGTTGRILTKQRCRVADLGSAKCVFDTRHVLYSKLRPYLNKVVLPDAPGVGTSELIPLLPAEKRLDREFLAYYLRSKAFVDFANANTRGANLPRIAMTEFWGHKIPVPASMDDQQRIVGRIKECIGRVEDIDRLRTSARQEAQAVLPSILNEVFATLNGVTPVKTVGELSLETRYGTSRRCHTEPRGLPILRIPNVEEGSINFDELKFCELGDSDLRRVRLNAGDLLFVRTNGSRDLVGRCAVFEEPAKSREFGFASYLIRVRLDTGKVLPRYLAYFLNSTNGRVEINKRRRTSAGQFNINSENLCSIPLPVPSVTEQQRLMEVLQRREHKAIQLVREINSAADQGRVLRESVLRKAFAGEL